MGDSYNPPPDTQIRRKKCVHTREAAQFIENSNNGGYAGTLDAATSEEPHFWAR